MTIVNILTKGAIAMAAQTNDVSQSAKAAPSGDLFEMVSGWAVIWGAVAAFVLLFNHVVAAEVGLGRSPRLITDGILVVATFLVVTRLWERLPRAQELVRKYRHAIVLAVVGTLAYQWGGYNQSRSYQALLGRAAVWACAKFPDCRKTAQRYDVGDNIVIPVGGQSPR